MPDENVQTIESKPSAGGTATGSPQGGARKDASRNSNQQGSLLSRMGLTRDPEEEVLRKAHEGTKKATRFLVRAIMLAEVLILLALVVGLFAFRGSFTVYEGTAITLIMIWIAILIPYFAWATYFFNINFGLTNEDWAEIKIHREKWIHDQDLRELLLEAPERMNQLKMLLSQRGLKIPDRNPHHDQTMGLPPGTIRGMLALTVSIGGLAMFIASLGMDSRLAPNSFFVDNLEFFKTAFLMVIAFYFGSKSLEILQRDRTGPVYGTPGAGGAPPAQPTGLPSPELEAEPSPETKTLTPTTLLAPSPDAAAATQVKKALLGSEGSDETAAPSAEATSDFDNPNAQG